MEERGKKYTIEDIAREIGVSKTTVSRAISGKGRIGQNTREKVLRFIEEHDYRPNVMAKGLAQNRTYNLGLLLPMDYAVTEFPFFKDCMNGICEVAAEYDYDIIISMVENNELTKIQRLVSNRKVDGIIVSRALVSSEAQTYLQENKVPFVLIGTSDDSNIVSVDNQNQEASKELTSIMLMKRIQRIALIGGKKSHVVTGSRYEGFAKAHQELGAEIDPALVFLDVDDESAAETAVKKALEQKAEGILCMDDVICRMVFHILRDLGISIPEQVKLASLYDSRYLEHNVPSITSVKFDTVKLGRNACIRLLNLLGTETEEDMLPLSYQVALRESTL